MRFNNLLYLSVTHICSRLYYYIVQIILVLISIVLVYSAVDIHAGVFDILSSTDKVFAHSKDYLWHIKSDYIIDDIEYGKRYLKFLAELENNYSIGKYELSSVKFSEDDTEVPVLKINNPLLKVCDIKDSDKNVINLKDDEIAIGSAYAAKYSIGSVLQDAYTKKSYKVSYIIDGNQKWTSVKFLDDKSINNLDQYIIMPNTDIHDELLYTYLNDNNFLINTNGNIQSDIEKIERLAEEKGVYLSIYSYNEAKWNCILNEFEGSGLFFLEIVMVIILNLFIILISYLIIWNSSNKEIGIFLSMGLVGKDIRKIFHIESIIIYLAATIISYTFCCLYFDNEIYKSVYKMLIFGIIWMLFGVCIILFTDINFALLKKDNPNKLMEK